MNGSNFEPSQFQMHMLAREIVSLDDFLSHLTIHPVSLHAKKSVSVKEKFLIILFKVLLRDF